MANAMRDCKQEAEALVESSKAHSGSTVVVEYDSGLIAEFEKMPLASFSKTGRGTIFYGGSLGDEWAVCVRDSPFLIKEESSDMALGLAKRSAISGDSVWVDYDWELFRALNTVSTLNLTAKDGAISTMRGEWSGRKWEVSMRKPPRDKECRCLLDSAPVLIGLGLVILMAGMWLGT
jgi:hypothetical protein